MNVTTNFQRKKIKAIGYITVYQKFHSAITLIYKRNKQMTENRLLFLIILFA